MVSSDRRWLNVPYADRGVAKSVGAQWDSLVKMWWVPLHVPLALVKQWAVVKCK